MSRNVEQIETYQFDKGEKLFLDANIWQSIYGIRKPSDSRVAIYSKALQNILSKECHIYIDILVVSEFINVYAKDRWGIAKNENKTYKKFKHFRDSEDFLPVAQEIADAVKRILRHCIRLDSGFVTFDMDSILKEYTSGKVDFNDQAFAILCQQKKLKLVTDDKDYLNLHVSIITANKRLLGSI